MTHLASTASQRTTVVGSSQSRGWAPGRQGAMCLNSSHVFTGSLHWHEASMIPVQASLRAHTGSTPTMLPTAHV